MRIFEEAKAFMEDLSQTADFFEKAKKKQRPLLQGDFAFAGTR